MLQDLTLKQLEAERKKVNDEIKRVFCSRSEEQGRDEKIAALQEMLKVVKAGISQFNSLSLRDIQGIETGKGTR